MGVVIPAGGRGVRMGRRIPKQFLPLAGVPVIVRAVAAFDSLPPVHEIVVVAPRRYLSKTRRLMKRAKFEKVVCVVAGGRERQDSVLKGLRAFHAPPDIILVHDAVRPLIERRTILEVIRLMRTERAVAVGIPVKDTVKRESSPGYYDRTVDRSGLWAVQTPQAFRSSLLQKAHDRARRDRFLGTDESSLVERLGIPVRIVRGSTLNLKMTTKEDMILASALLRSRNRRT